MKIISEETVSPQKGWIGNVDQGQILKINGKSVIDFNLIHYNELKLIGTQNASLQNYIDIVKIIDQLKNVDKLITHVYKLEEVPLAYQDRANLKGVKSIIDFNI